ncbi:MAG: hypothetical protein QOI61_2531 [Actinomycetota bacterium]|jgi:hypothetical protein
MAERKVWRVEEFEALSPEERQAIFEASVVYDLDTLDPEYVARIREKGRKLLEERGILPTESG